MSGLELARVAKRKDPDLRVIITSGYYEVGEVPRGASFLNLSRDD
jgi:hypothetical protein